MKEKEAIAAITEILLKQDNINDLAQRKGFTEALTEAMTKTLYPRNWLLKKTAILDTMESHIEPLAKVIGESLIGFSINGNAMSEENKIRLPARIQLAVASYQKNPEKTARAAAPAASSSAPAFQQASAAYPAKQAEDFIPFEKPAAKPKEATAISRLNAERAKQAGKQQKGGYGSFQ